MGFYKKFASNRIFHYKEEIEDYFDEIGYKEEFLKWKINYKILFDLKIINIITDS
jgi:hypothetical protein